MPQLIECVPNFSEGCNQDIINQITQEIETITDVILLDVDPGKDTNRTVVTFVGSPENVIDAAFLAIKKAAQLIDMSVHQGTHPRLGATDVCPLIPIRGISLEECVSYAHKLAQRIGEELHIPVYLYGEAASRPERRKLSDIRQGEYEALADKLKLPEFQPDAGPAEFNSATGATVVGVRDFMLAYNVNLNTKDTRLAREIAMNIRESGRAKRDNKGKIMRDQEGKAIKIPGKLSFCQAAGWYIDEYGYAQVTMNLHNYSVTGLHTAFEEVSKEAEILGLRVTGSELVGLAPKQAIIDAGLYYLQKQNRNIGIPETDIIHIAILSLGLHDTTKFDPQNRIIEYRINQPENRLIDLTLEEFANELSSDSVAPGGGSISALSGALAAGLISMVANVTYGKKGYEKNNKKMEEISIKAQQLKEHYLELIDLDTNAFNDFMKAMRMPKKTETEKASRAAAMEQTAQNATKVPFATLKASLTLMELARICIYEGNENALSDAAVSVFQAEAAAEGAWMNVLINLPSIKDKRFVSSIQAESDTILELVKNKRKQLSDLTKERLSS